MSFPRILSGINQIPFGMSLSMRDVRRKRERISFEERRKRDI